MNHQTENITNMGNVLKMSSLHGKFPIFSFGGEMISGRDLHLNKKGLSHLVPLLDLERKHLNSPVLFLLPQDVADVAPQNVAIAACENI